MRKWSMMGLLQVVSLGLFAQEDTTTGEVVDNASPTAFVVIGVIILIVVIYVLYSRQKRRYND